MEKCSYLRNKLWIVGNDIFYQISETGINSDENLFAPHIVAHTDIPRLDIDKKSLISF